MWWAGGKAVQAYLGSRRLMCQGRDLPPLDREVASLDLGLDLLLAHLGAAARTECGVSLFSSGSQCRPFMMEPIDGLRGHAELMAIASSVAPARVDLVAPCVAWLAASSGRDVPSLAVAMSQPWVNALQDRFASAGHRLVSLRPWWALALKATLSKLPKGQRALAVVDCDSVTVLAGNGKAFTGATAHAPVLDAAVAASVVARAAFTLGIDASNFATVMWNDRLVAADARPLACPFGEKATLHHAPD